MFSNRLVLFYAAALSFLLAPSCSKQSDDGDGGKGGTFSTENSIFAGGSGSGNGTGAGNTGNQLPGGLASDPNLVGAVTPITKEQSQEIAKSACNAWAIEPEASPSKLILLVDVSSSMSNKAPGTNRTKWEVTRDALVEAVCGVTGTGLSGNTAVGLMFYPNMVNENVSKTPVEPSVCLNTGGITPMDYLGNNDAGTQRTILRTALTQAILGRGTPTADAYAYTLSNLALSAAQQDFPGETYILLITDGMPTLNQGCYNPSGSLSNLPGDPIVTLVNEAYGRGVKTFIIGSPGSEEGKGWLSKAASVGGTGKPGCNPDAGAAGPLCHMDMTTAPDFSVALRDGLNQVVQAVSGCKFDVPTESSDGSKQVDLNAISPILHYADGSSEIASRDNKNGANCKEGYHLISATQMELCQDTCARFTADSKATMQIIFGCTDD
ncbi:MAG TPA: vWA domain-containing protein, partial [Polyangiaceae bacterium]